MKNGILGIFYGIFALSALAGAAASVMLYPTHGANGTSAGYFTMVIFPTVFLLTGLAGIRFRYWWGVTALLWLGLAGYFLTLQETGTGFPFLLAVYLFLALAAGTSGMLLRRQLSRPK